MSDNPNILKSALLSEATTDQQRALAKLLAEQCAEADLRSKGHKCWLFVPARTEYELMARFADNDTCPSCGTGRIVLEPYHGNLGTTLWLKCYWGDPDCTFRQDVTDHER